jgi:hypothetical protein
VFTNEKLRLETKPWNDKVRASGLAFSSLVFVARSPGLKEGGVKSAECHRRTEREDETT